MREHLEALGVVLLIITMGLTSVGVTLLLNKLMGD
jgi:hypothetical protein